MGNLFENNFRYFIAGWYDDCENSQDKIHQQISQKHFWKTKVKFCHSTSIVHSMNVCLTNYADKLIEAVPMYEKLIEISRLQGQVLVPVYHDGGGGSSRNGNAVDLQSGSQKQLTRSYVEKSFQTLTWN